MLFSFPIPIKLFVAPSSLSRALKEGAKEARAALCLSLSLLFAASPPTAFSPLHPTHLPAAPAAAAAAIAKLPSLAIFSAVSHALHKLWAPHIIDQPTLATSETILGARGQEHGQFNPLQKALRAGV